MCPVGICGSYIPRARFKHSLPPFFTEIMEFTFLMKRTLCFTEICTFIQKVTFIVCSHFSSSGLLHSCMCYHLISHHRMVHSSTGKVFVMHNDLRPVHTFSCQWTVIPLLNGASAVLPIACIWSLCEPGAPHMITYV